MPNLLHSSLAGLVVLRVFMLSDAPARLQTGLTWS